MTTQLREYIVTVHKDLNLEEFYHDMEAKTNRGCTPDRAVECVRRRPHSRSTHYLLTDSEAEQLRSDLRIVAVEITPKSRGITIRPLNQIVNVPYSGQDSGLLRYNKSYAVGQSHMNWGLRRCTLSVQIPTWGSDEITNNNDVVLLEAIGRNVDVVIADSGRPVIGHPEFAVNYDGTGGTRLIEYDWYDLDPIVKGTGKISTYVAQDDDHATHVAGTVAGNRQGWARGANIYHISFVDIDPIYLFDYIRAFHRNKPVNPKTGLRNPTIVNNSWGYFVPGDSWTTSSVTSITYRGLTHEGPFDLQQLASYGVFPGSNIPVPILSINAEVEDAIDDGIMFVGAAGNDSAKIDVPGGLDWDNRMVVDGFNYYYHRGASPTASTSTLENITVGSTNLLSFETKAEFSNAGPGVDLYAPGLAIMSAVTSSKSVKVFDSRNNGYHLSKMDGTSMACPQVCGVIACCLEIYPRWSQSDAKSFILDYARPDVINDTDGDYSDSKSLYGGSNRHLKYPRLIPTEGVVQPTPFYGFRPTSGQLFPRPRIFRYGTLS
jgi:subtilisin family serine protease